MHLVTSLIIDLIYAVAAVVSLPVWLIRLIRTGKIRTDWAGRFGRVSIRAKRSSRPRLLFHAVSVGEVNAIRRLVDELDDDFEIVIASTTNTGYCRAVDIYGSKHQVVRYPFDFSPAVSQFLNTVGPDAAVLVELEVWPNFIRSCRRRGIQVVVVNGRLSARSFARYRRIRPIIAPMFRSLKAVGAQDADVANRFIALGTKADRVVVQGTMKWDNATIADDAAGSDKLADSFGINRAKPIVVAGSTAEGEETLIHEAVPPNVQLIVAPRKPERFDEAAAALGNGVIRRTECMKNHERQPSGGKRFLLDTIGELKTAYALADLVIVGRTFGNLYGSDMIEPIALGKATIVGPRTSDFDSIMCELLAGDGIVQIRSRSELKKTVAHLLNDESARRRLGERGRQVIRRNQGAVERHAEMIRHVMNARPD